MKNVMNRLNGNFFLVMSLFLSLALVTSCNDDDEGGSGGGDTDLSSVVASFTSQVDANNSLTYSFTNNSVVNGITDTSFTSAWDFGGDGTSTEESPTYTFSGEGSYDVTLTVTATDGVSESITETVEVTAPKNRYAIITDSFGDGNLNADGNTDTGELRILTDSIQNGRLTFMYRVAAGPSADIQDGFINVSGSSTTGDFAIMEVRLKDDAAHAFREGASDDLIAAADALWPIGAPDVWVPIEISWAADGVNTPLFSLSIDGITICTDATSTTNGGAGDEPGHLAATMNGAHNFQWKYSSNSTISDGMFHVDDIVLYSSDSGTETVVFEDNFQGRTAGDNLNPGADVDNPLTPYHVNTVDASVGEDE